MEKQTSHHDPPDGVRTGVRWITVLLFFSLCLAVLPAGSCKKDDDDDVICFVDDDAFDDDDCIPVDDDAFDDDFFDSLGQPGPAERNALSYAIDRFREIPGEGASRRLVDIEGVSLFARTSRSEYLGDDVAEFTRRVLAENPGLFAADRGKLTLEGVAFGRRGVVVRWQRPRGGVAFLFDKTGLLREINDRVND